jgi:hypothetical protein
MYVCISEGRSLVKGDEVGELLGGGGISRGLFLFPRYESDLP